MNSVLMALAALLLICSLGLNVIQFFALRLRERVIRALERRAESLKERLVRDEMFHWRVQLAEEAFQESCKS